VAVSASDADRLVKSKAHSQTAEQLILLAKDLCSMLENLAFAPPVSHVYNPLIYAWAPYETYLRKFASGRKRVVFLGMNPGPFGMVQTGVPFGEVSMVRDWLKIAGAVEKPLCQHPRRPISGFECARSEVSGRRLWGLFAERFRTPAELFREHFVLNYCPLAFLESSGCNRTPDRLPATEREALFAACDGHLRAAIAVLQPEWVIGIGDFAFKRASQIFPGGTPAIGRVLHPSPASPAANRDWAGLATRQLETLGVWKSLA
jgi:single-strand selective monofunctional uracil DNA glycosylase